MSEEQLKAFLLRLQEDSALQEQLKNATNVDDVVAAANKAGFSITDVDLNSQSLADQELEAVAGGVETADIKKIMHVTKYVNSYFNANCNNF